MRCIFRRWLVVLCRFIAATAFHSNNDGNINDRNKYNAATMCVSRWSGFRICAIDFLWQQNFETIGVFLNKCSMNAWEMKIEKFNMWGSKWEHTTHYFQNLVPKFLSNSLDS